MMSKYSSTYINMASTEAEKTWVMLTTNILGNNLLAELNHCILNVKLLILRPEYTIRNTVFKTSLGHGFLIFLKKMLALI